MESQFGIGVIDKNRRALHEVLKISKKEVDNIQKQKKAVSKTIARYMPVTFDSHPMAKVKPNESHS